MPDFRAWLRSVRLEHLADVLEGNRVDFDVLEQLTDRDLAELGVPLGDRKRLLAAIAERGRRGERTAASPRRPPVRGEYLHHLTVVFVDLVGSTLLSESLDVEDYRATLRHYHECCSRRIEDHNGFVARYVGDGILAYFGYPRALEDDAEQAVHAALAIVRAVPELETPGGVELRARVGVATGEVLSNQLAGDARDQDDIYGETPNLAARLQEIAEPSTVVVSGATHALLGSQFECTDLGAIPLKGFSKAPRVFRVERATTPQSRFRARQRASVTPLVGREEELGLLLKRWRSASAGEGKAVFITGEAGIGKSRLLEALYDELRGQAHVRLRYQCSPHRTRSAFHPIIAQLTWAADIEPDEPAAARRAKLARVLLPPDPEADGSDEGTLRPFARLLSINGDGDGDGAGEEAGGESGSTFHERIRAALMRQLERLAATQPVLVTFEDVHWIDPSSAELLSTLVHEIAGLPVMLVCTYRSEYDAGWIDGAGVSKLHLNRLDRPETGRMVELIAGGDPLDPDTARTIVERTEGVPLFVEEMTRTVVEGSHGGGPARDARGEAAAQVLPSTLNDLLAAKLDSLGDANAITASCAVLGRSFSRSLLAAVCDLADDEVEAALDTLVAQHVLVRQSRRRDPVYSFRHALIQEIAYALLLKSRRRVLHRRIAEVLQSAFPERAERNPEVLAHHYAEADMPRPARDSWTAAANLAIERAAYIEAIAHLKAALEQNARLPDAEERLRAEIELRERLVIPLEARFWGSAEIAENLNRLHELQRERGGELDQFAVLHGLYGTHVIGAQPDVAIGYARQMSRIAASTDVAIARDRAALKLMSRHALGMCHFVMGRFPKAIENYAAAVAIGRRGGVDLVRQYYLADMVTVDLCMLTWARVLSGAADDAAAEIAEAAGVVEVGEQSFTKAYGLSILASAHQAVGDAVACRSCATRALELAARFNFRYWEAWARILLGWAEVADGGGPDGAARLERGLEAYRRTGSKQIVPYAKVLLADARARLGDHVAARRLLSEVESDAAFRHVRFQDPIARRVADRVPDAPAENGEG